MLQKARETTIAYQRLESEMEKKEILLCTIAEGMNTTLANIITSLHLLELENNSSRTRQLLVLANRATTEQQTLIHKILNLFSAELEALYGREGGGISKASLQSVLRSVEAALTAAFNEKKVRLTKTGEAGPNLEVAMESAHLQRVLTTLLENALARAPAGSDVQLEIRNEPESIVLRIIDGGAPQPDEMPKMDPGMDSMSESELRLRFCRVAVENCQGEIGREEIGEEGNCFWIRLPKAVSVS
jgi:signal transduction histidine kinase